MNVEEKSAKDNQWSRGEEENQQNNIQNVSFFVESQLFLSFFV